VRAVTDVSSRVLVGSEGGNIGLSQSPPGAVLGFIIMPILVFFLHPASPSCPVFLERTSLSEDRERFGRTGGSFGMNRTNGYSGEGKNELGELKCGACSGLAC
jgi:hypothetical protein